MAQPTLERSRLHARTAPGPRPLPSPVALADPDDTAAWDALLPERWYARRGRRALDWALLVLLLPPALPLMALVGLGNLCVFRDPRRVFFSQPRAGWRGRTFRILKFRTMRELEGPAPDGCRSASDRLRVTRFGRFLRNTHLDELPQLFNVLRGEMAFIGPRPEMVEMEAWAAAHVPGFSQRLALRPGITGWAQVTQGYTGQDVAAYAEKLERNREYMHRVSLGFDLALVVRTAVWMVRGRGWQWNAGAKATLAPAPRSEAGQGALDGQRRRAS